MKIRRNSTRAKGRVMAETDVAAEASELLLETEDAAQLIAEITGEDVEVTVDENMVAFTVGEETYTCEAEGDEEEVEASSMAKKGMRRVSASTAGRKPKRYGKTLRKMPRR